jgi:hypothetical protein
VVKKESQDLPDLLEQLVRQVLMGLRGLRVLLEHQQKKINHGNWGIFSKRGYTLLHIDEGSVAVLYAQMPTSHCLYQYLNDLSMKVNKTSDVLLTKLKNVRRSSYVDQSDLSKW